MDLGGYMIKDWTTQEDKPTSHTHFLTPMMLFRPNLKIVPTIVGTGPNLSVKVGTSQL